MTGRTFVIFSISIVLIPISLPVQAEVTVPDTGQFVNDRADVIDQRTEQQLELWLRDLEQKTTAQVKVLTVETTDGEDFFGFVQRHAELWKLGQKGKDNGVLIAIATKDRTDRIQIGYGLEGLLPDSWCGSLRRKMMVPYYKKGRLGEGLFRGAVAIANKIADDANVVLTGAPKIRYNSRRGKGKPAGMACGGIIPLVIMLAIFSGRGRGGGGRGRWGGGGFWQAMMIGSLLNGMMGGRRSSWGGGGFSSGFGGGFGGSFGGGGGFGGGGAGGSW